MRVSTATVYDSGVHTIQRQTTSLLHTQQTVATGRRVLTPADDPVAAARALEVIQAREISAQQRTNQDNARTSLGLLEDTLATVGDLIHNVRERAIQIGNPALSRSDRQAIGAELRVRFEELLGYANATDGTGLYLFSGYQGATKPFSGSVENGVGYVGDDGQRLLQVGPSRQMAVSDSGADVFLRIRNGNGSFSTGISATNQGSGEIDAGNVLSAYNGHGYVISFTPAGNGLTYRVDDTTAGGFVTQGTFTSGEAISFNGISVTIRGTPAATDVFTVTPSTSESLFDTISNLIGAVESEAVDPGASTRLTNSVGQALTNLSQALDNILQVRASVGIRLAEVDSLSDLADDLILQHQSTLSRLQDVDYAAAITQLTQERANLEAAQQSFLRVSQLSLFNYL